MTGGSRVGFVALVAALVVSSTSAEVVAGARQLHGGPVAGVGGLAGANLALAGAVGAQLHYGITDAFRFSTSIEAPLGSDVTRGGFWSWPGLTMGVGYALDVGTVVPWLVIEARAAAVLSSASMPNWLVGGGARLGVDWLPQRYLGLTIQGTYSACFFDGGLAHAFGLVAGPRWTLDL